MLGSSGLITTGRHGQSSAVVRTSRTAEAGPLGIPPFAGSASLSCRRPCRRRAPVARAPARRSRVIRATRGRSGAWRPRGRGDNLRTIARFTGTLNESKYRGQSIVWPFFKLFHYGTCFAWLDRRPDMKCHGRTCPRLQGAPRSCARALSPAESSASPFPWTASLSARRRAGRVHERASGCARPKRGARGVLGRGRACLAATGLYGLSCSLLSP